ncbi:MAG: PAS domain-containing protein [Lachnospiraceae bacterium]
MEEILNGQISGFHQYVLSEPVHLSYISQNLCEMLKVTEGDLRSNDRDMYALLVKPCDREEYSAFLKRLAGKEQTLTIEYRLVKKDGSEIWVRDTGTSQKTEDGVMLGSFVLTDITDLKSENSDLHFLNETIPCGLLKYTCEKQPRITYINQIMIDILRFPKVKAGETDYLELYKSNIFLMIPMEERRRFSMYLNRVYSAEEPIAGEMTLLRCDGTRAYVFGWVTKYVNEQGVAEFQSVCMDITKRYQSRKAMETKRYLKALSDVYDKIFEFNTSSNTVKCLYCEDSSMFKRFEGITMQSGEAVERWIVDSVEPDARDRVRSFFGDFLQKKLYGTWKNPPQISYKARSSDGELKQYSGIFIKEDETVSLYCCRNVSDPGERLRIENHQLREDMKELAMHFTDGVAAFEVSADNSVKPLYASENLCEFFGYTQEEWLTLMDRYTPLERFVARCEVPYEQFAKLLKTGGEDFSYYNDKTATELRMKAVCSKRIADSSTPRYVMLYYLDETKQEKRKESTQTCRVSIRTFGYFDVFVEEKPIAFRNKKSKELFALLVDRRGGYVSSDEAIGFLWEGEPVNSVTLARYRKVALRLKNILEEYGIADVIESKDGKRRIVMENVECDLYDYLSGKEEYAQLFKGSYLSNYSWGETTLAELTGKIVF